MPGEVPLDDAGGRLLGWVVPDFLDQHGPHLRVIRNRRGHPRRAYLRFDDSDLVQWLERTGRRSSYGAAFLQHPDGRVCWALRGTPGSR
ncbi:MAG: hypothetical protein KatS3mg005_2085 [Bryobacteraceae bacterium]|nr:MAG: hypothetical protein KatS3mg005_2085 [Bryobacteraceae bacterium]